MESQHFHGGGFEEGWKPSWKVSNNWCRKLFCSSVNSLTIIRICMQGWSTQIAWSGACIGDKCFFYSIWHCKNKLRFDIKVASFTLTTNMINTKIALTIQPRVTCLLQSRNSKSWNHFLLQFMLGAPQPSRKLHGIYPLPCNRTKCITDGVAQGSSGRLWRNISW